MSWFNRSKTTHVPDLASSILYDETTFYNRFTSDLKKAKREVIIESPYITSKRTELLMPIFKRLVERRVKIYIITRDPKEHSEAMEIQSESTIHQCEVLGIQVLLCTGNHHRKLAILDRRILWEGSLNILSQTHSREIMRRIESRELTEEMFRFLELNKFI